jgi:CheY-like chemotaxis protein
MSERARILAVDDTPHNLDLITYLLNAAGHHVIGADSGESALDMARVHQPDLIVLDVQLPGMDGYAVLDQIRKDPVLAPTCVIAVTAYAMVGDRADALSAGFDGYLAKPIDPLTFADTIATHLTQPARAPLGLGSGE